MHAFEGEAEDRRGGSRGGGGLRPPRVEEKSPVAVSDLHALTVRHAPEPVAEDWQQHAVLQTRIRRVPVNVEVACKRRAGAVLKEVLPPRVLRARDAHVVRHHVNDEAHLALAQTARELDERALAARLRVDLRVVNDVVAVRASRARPQHRRRVAVGDAEFAEVFDERACLLEGEVAVELEPVGGDGYACLHNSLAFLPARSRKRNVRPGRARGSLPLSGGRAPPWAVFPGQRTAGLIDRADGRAVKLPGLFRELLVRNQQLLALLALAGRDAARALRLHPGLVDFGRDLLDVRQVHASPPAPAAWPAAAPSRCFIAT